MPSSARSIDRPVAERRSIQHRLISLARTVSLVGDIADLAQ